MRVFVRLGIVVLIGATLTTIGISELHKARGKATGVRLDGGFDVPVTPRDMTYSQALAQVQAWERQAMATGQEFNPHVHRASGGHTMVQNEQMASMMVQHRGNKPGYCFDIEHLPEHAPEGSQVGCECGANCDEDGNPVGMESDKCERHCDRKKCQCGTCF